MVAGRFVVYVFLVCVVAAFLIFAVNYFSCEGSEGGLVEKWRSIVGTLVSNSVWLEVRDYMTGSRVLVGKGDPVFDGVLGFIESSVLRRVVSKTIVTNNMTVHVTVPYPYCYLLTFELRNGVKFRLNLVPEGTIYFETENAIFEVKVDPELVKLVRSILSNVEINLIKQEVYREGLKLLVTLNSTKLKCGETLAVHVVLVNINNTDNIAVAALQGGINLAIYDSQENIVYAVKMVNPGPTPPYPIFKPGHEIAVTFRWDTSRNILNGDMPPPPGEYYVEVEAYVTDLDTYSKLTLKTERIEVKLLES